MKKLSKEEIEKRMKFYHSAFVTCLLLISFSIVLKWFSKPVKTKHPPSPLSSDKQYLKGRDFIAENIGVFEVTAYCPCEICCEEYADGITACGYKIQKGDKFVAAPKMIPFGTELIITNYNRNEPVGVLDRGGAIKVGRLDVYFDTHEEALKWGRQWVEVYWVR